MFVVKLLVERLLPLWHDVFVYGLPACQCLLLADIAMTQQRCIDHGVCT